MEEGTLIKINISIDKSSLIFLTVFAYLFFIVTGYISLLRTYYSGMFLNLINYKLHYDYSGDNLVYYVGIQMDDASIRFFYTSILIVCLINLITLIRYYIKKSDIQKYYFGNNSFFIFLPLILFGSLNFFGYSRVKDYKRDNFINIPNIRLIFSLCICIIGIILLFVFYYKSFIKNYEETKEENSKYLLKIFYEVLLIFYLYYFFHLIQLLRIKGKIKDIDEFRNLFKKERQIPFKFQIVMASIIETVFGLIGLVIIFFGKAFAYAFYQIFIYVAFLIIRADKKKIKGYHDKIKLSIFDYFISIFMLLSTLVCLGFIIKKKKLNYNNDYRYI